MAALDAKLQTFVRDGFVHIKGAIDPKSVTNIEELLKIVKGTADGLDGAKQVDAAHPAATQLQKQVNAIAARAAELAGLKVGPAVEMQKKSPWLIRKLWLDDTAVPKITTITVGPEEGSGPLPWHLDHFTYYANQNHKDHIICYLPVVKANPQDSNLCVVPYTALSPTDLAGTVERGAMHFVKLSEENLSAIQAGGLAATAADYGKWVAVDDFYDTSAGFVMDTDLEAAKVVPQLEPFDLLLVRADVVHRTADNNVYRVSLRFDLGPDQSWSTLGTLHRYTKTKKSTHAIICGWFARWPRVAPLLMFIHSFKRFSLKCVGYITPFKSIDVETPPFVLTKA